MDIGCQELRKCKKLGTTGTEEGLDSWPVTDRDETCRSSHSVPYNCDRSGI